MLPLMLAVMAYTLELGILKLLEPLFQWAPYMCPISHLTISLIELGHPTVHEHRLPCQWLSGCQCTIPLMPAVANSTPQAAIAKSPLILTFLLIFTAPPMSTPLLASTSFALMAG
jgi:hypothetical protein